MKKILLLSLSNIRKSNYKISFDLNKNFFLVYRDIQPFITNKHFSNTRKKVAHKLSLTIEKILEIFTLAVKKRIVSDTFACWPISAEFGQVCEESFLFH